MTISDLIKKVLSDCLFHEYLHIIDIENFSGDQWHDTKWRIPEGGQMAISDLVKRFQAIVCVDGIDQNAGRLSQTF